MLINKIDLDLISNKNYTKIGLFFTDEDVLERVKHNLNNLSHEISYDCVDEKNGKYIALLFKKEYFNDISDEILKAKNEGNK